MPEWKPNAEFKAIREASLKRGSREAAYFCEQVCAPTILELLSSRRFDCARMDKGFALSFMPLGSSFTVTSLIYSRDAVIPAPHI